MKSDRAQLAANILNSISSYLIWMHDDMDDAALDIIGDCKEQICETHGFCSFSHSEAYDYASKWQGIAHLISAANIAGYAEALQ